jgi:hypothetical protein
VSLALIFGARRIAIPLEANLSFPRPSGPIPLVLEELARVLLVVSPAQYPADVLRRSDHLWEWVEKVSSRGPIPSFPGFPVNVIQGRLRPTRPVIFVPSSRCHRVPRMPC